MDISLIRARLDESLRRNYRTAAIYGAGGSNQVFITPRLKRIIDLAKEESSRLR